jgi:hypothetical protein
MTLAIAVGPGVKTPVVTTMLMVRRSSGRRMDPMLMVSVLIVAGETALLKRNGAEPMESITAGSFRSHPRHRERRRRKQNGLAGMD